MKRFNLEVAAVLVLLCTVQTLAQSTNLALDKPTSQSSTYAAGGDPSRAVDGDTNGTWGGYSLTHTNNDYHAWWQVDLGNVYDLGEIKLWNRTDCCPERLSNFYVLVSDEPFETTDLYSTRNQPRVTSIYMAGSAGSPTTFSVGRTGRYVRVQLAGTNYLTLAEVEVVGTVAKAATTFNGQANNIALASNKATVKASSTHSAGYAPEGAINGDRAGRSWGNGGGWNNAPNSPAPHWLEVTLPRDEDGKPFGISKINVFSVQDNYGNPCEPALVGNPCNPAQPTMTFTRYGLVDFTVEYQHPSTGAWTALPGGVGNITGNNKVWVQITFPSLKTGKIRLTVTKTPDHYVRVAELEVIMSQKGCPSPSDQEEELLLTIEGNYKGDAGIKFWDGYREEATVRWRKCLQPTFAAWKQNGSQNLPVLAAAIGLFRQPGDVMAGNNPNNIRYANWWADFLAYQVGAKVPPDDKPALGHFKGTELFSNMYDAPVVSSIVAVRYWASVKANRDAFAPHGEDIRRHARKYLRANWYIYALSAGTPAPSKDKVSPQRYDIPEARFTFNSQAPLQQFKRYGGHFLAMAGSRSNIEHWTEGERRALFDRAIQYSNDPAKTDIYDVRPSNEGLDQRLLLNHLKGRWPTNSASNPDYNENIYGLTLAERNGFKRLILSGNLNEVSSHTVWLDGIHTWKTVHLVGWSVNGKQVRVSTLASNPNGNNPAMYGVKFEEYGAKYGTSTASFLYPWTDESSAGEQHKAGICTWEPRQVVASQPGVYRASGYPVHPPHTVHMPIPVDGEGGATMLFHIVLAARPTKSYHETLPQQYFPAPEPYDPWPFDPPGEDPEPPEN